LWTERERLELAVWADELQLGGEPLGELVATWLALERQVLAGADEAALAKIRVRLAELERVVIDPIFAELLAPFPEIMATWSHGVIIALRLGHDTHGRLLPSLEARSASIELLKRPVARFLRTVDICNPTGGFAGFGGTLIARETVAQPWWVAFGRLPESSPRIATLEELTPSQRHLAQRLLETNSQLRELWIDGIHVALPWCEATDLVARMHICEQLCARERFDEASLTALARALWDPQTPVRVRVLEALPRLGVDAAPMIPSLCCVDPTAYWSAAIREALDLLARDPELVLAVARNFTAAQSRCALWLSELSLPVARAAKPRVEAMITGPQRATGWDHKLLVEARRRMDQPPPSVITRPLRRVMRWLDGTWP
jgi:hypothetical protein